MFASFGMQIYTYNMLSYLLFVISISSCYLFSFLVLEFLGWLTYTKPVPNHLSSTSVYNKIYISPLSHLIWSDNNW